MMGSSENHSVNIHKNSNSLFTHCLRRNQKTAAYAEA